MKPQYSKSGHSENNWPVVSLLRTDRICGGCKCVSVVEQMTVSFQYSFSVSWQRVALDYNGLFWESNALSKALIVLID